MLDFSLNKSIRKILKKIPYNDIIITNIIPKNAFVLAIANLSNAFDTFIDKICINGKITAIKIPNISIENRFSAVIIIKNQKDSPIDTVRALKRGEDNSI